MNKSDVKAILEVREIIAIGVAGMFIALAVMGKIDPKIVEFVVISVISFYFASKGSGSANDIANNVVNQMSANTPTSTATTPTATAPNVVPTMVQAITPVVESIIESAITPIVPETPVLIKAEPANDVPAQG